MTPTRTEPPPPSKREVMLRRFTSRYGRDNVVVIRVSHADGLRPGVLVAQLAQDLGSEHFLATPPSAEALLAVNYSGEIEDVTQHIDWGKVTSTDRQQRLKRTQRRYLPSPTAAVTFSSSRAMQW